MYTFLHPTNSLKSWIVDGLLLALPALYIVSGITYLLVRDSIPQDPYPYGGPGFVDGPITGPLVVVELVFLLVYFSLLLFMLTAAIRRIMFQIETRSHRTK